MVCRQASSLIFSADFRKAEALAHTDDIKGFFPLTVKEGNSVVPAPELLLAPDLLLMDALAARTPLTCSETPVGHWEAEGSYLVCSSVHEC